MGRIYQVIDPTRLRAQRERAPEGQVFEVWPDVFDPAACWLAEAAWLALRPAEDPPPVRLVIEGERVPVLFPSEIVRADSMPELDAVRTRLLARHGIAALWIPPGEVGPQVLDTAVGPQDLFFFLKRAGTDEAHLWRLFRSRYDARGFLGRRYPGDLRVADWVAALPFEDFEALAAAS
ncbi:MAG TPA: hypothetical protein VF406_19385 [Thermodesulfobacteriota bacterium]